ncbi:MAG: HAD-IB family phosphatase [bacterium]|nr:HAD-IB family phosphatase [bacterium]
MKQRIAFFDVDGTVVQGNVEFAFIRSLAFRGQIGLRAFLWTLIELIRPKPAGIASHIRANKGYLRGKTREHIASSVAACMAWSLRRIHPKARQEIARLHAEGVRVVLLSASLGFLLARLGENLGVEEIVGAEAEKRGEWYTGRLVPPQPFGAGKIVCAERILKRTGAAPEDCSAFGNSVTDAPLLAFVGEAIAVDPSYLLFRHATRLKWKITRW